MMMSPRIKIIFMLNVPTPVSRRDCLYISMTGSDPILLYSKKTVDTESQHHPVSQCKSDRLVDVREGFQ